MGTERNDVCAFWDTALLGASWMNDDCLLESSSPSSWRHKLSSWRHKRIPTRLPVSGHKPLEDHLERTIAVFWKLLDTSGKTKKAEAPELGKGCPKFDESPGGKSGAIFEETLPSDYDSSENSSHCVLTCGQQWPSWLASREGWALNWERSGSIVTNLFFMYEWHDKTCI